MTVHLEARKLSKNFGAFRANEDISVQFRKGTIHAIIGENGAGKSTLMKTLFGLHRPDSGEILVSGEVKSWRSPLDAIANGIGMVQQHFMLVPDLSAIDNIILGAERAGWHGLLDREKAIESVKSVLPSRKLEVPWLEKVETLPVGDRQKIEILKLLYRKAEILILDEPTAVLTPQEVEDLFEMLRSLRDAGRTIIIISHKLNEIFAICDDFTVLRTGKVTGQGSIKNTTRDQIVEYMMGTKLQPLSQTRTPVKTETIFECENLQDRAIKRGSLQGASFKVQGGEILGVAGVEGAGQTALVQAIMGLNHPEGKLEVLKKSLQSTADTRNIGVSLVPEDRIDEGLWPTETGYHNMIIGLEDRFTKGGIFSEDAIRTQTSEWAKSFDVRASSLEAPVGSFSGGNQQKLIFAREVAGRKPRFLVCHQPTRGVDLGAVRKIHQTLIGLRNEGLAILVISSDLDELMDLSDRISVMFDGKVVAEFKRENFDRMQIGRAMAGVATGSGQ